jgi:hypothetical protein
VDARQRAVEVGEHAHESNAVVERQRLEQRLRGEARRGQVFNNDN